MYLLDTNVVSEWAKPRPDTRVVQWLDDVDESQTWLSVLTLGELLSGVEQLHAGKRRSRLAGWLEHDLPLRFDRRIVAVDADIARRWGKLIALAFKSGVSLGAVDSLLAATALERNLTLVTRDDNGLQKLGINFLNPWRV